MSTVFDDVCVFNLLSGNFKGDPENPDWEALLTQAKLVVEEAAELLTAVEEKNMTDFRDAVCDISVTNYGAAYRSGMDYEKDLAVVNASNLSKFIGDNEEVAATYKFYSDLNVAVVFSGTFPRKVCKSQMDQTDINGKEYPSGKVLKNACWVPPVFD